MVGSALTAIIMKKNTRLLIYIFLWITAWLLAMVFLPISKSSAEAPEIPLKERSIQSIITYYADMYGVDPSVSLAVARCESGYDSSVKGDYKNGVPLALGLFQYHNETWNRHYKEFFNTTGITLDRNIPADNAQLANWAFSTGKGAEWTTMTALKKGGTYSFYSKLLGKHFTVTCKM